MNKEFILKHKETLVSQNKGEIDGIKFVREDGFYELVFKFYIKEYWQKWKVPLFYGHIPNHGQPNWGETHYLPPASLERLKKEFDYFVKEQKRVTAEAIESFRAQVQEIANRGFKIEFTWPWDQFGNAVFDVSVEPEDHDVMIEVCRKYELVNKIAKVGTREFRFEPR